MYRCTGVIYNRQCFTTCPEGTQLLVESISTVGPIRTCTGQYVHVYGYVCIYVCGWDGIIPYMGANSQSMNIINRNCFKSSTAAVGYHCHYSVRSGCTNSYSSTYSSISMYMFKKIKVCNIIIVLM